MKHEFIARCSSLGALMTNPRAKSETLSETAKKEIEKVVLFNKYGIEEDFSSKPTDKGIQNEPESIKIASDVLGWFDIPEKKTRLMNDWITGEPDVLTPSLLADVKSSFSGQTFPWFDLDECPNKNYFWQMQGYLMLTEREECELVYILTDTPEQMVHDMIQKAIWKMYADPGYSDRTQSEIEEIAEQRVRSMHNFAHIPTEKRVRQYIIKRDNDAIEQIKNRVDECRAYYDTIFNLI